MKALRAVIAIIIVAPARTNTLSSFAPMLNPWLAIPAADYEGHMDAVGQSPALRAIFAEVYAARRPRRLAILGCTTGSDLVAIDDAITETAIGVDVNPAYLAIARERLRARAPAPRLIEGDVLEVALPARGLDLVHAALLLEYVDPISLFARVRGWLAPGGVCSVVTQEPSADLPAVSATAYASLRGLEGHMSLRGADEIAALAARAGLRVEARRAVPLASGKILVASRFTV
jgi:SAM-dependent methyltransferase